MPFEATGGSKYAYPGDPTKNTGTTDNEYVEADLFRSGDRRFLMSSGPFSMASGDSQEVVFAIMHAADGEWDDSYLKLKEVDKIAQDFYDNEFATPLPPPKPHVSATALDDQIILTWDNSADTYISEDIIDRDPNTGEPTEYVFEGYNVYQIESLSGIGESKRIATFDKVNGIRKIVDDVFSNEYGKYINIFVQYGSDSGLSHSIQITQDALNNNTHLKINREYYFAVTAYGYNKYGIPKTLESVKEIIAVRPQVPNTWTAKSDTVQYGYSFMAEHIKGRSDGSVSVTVIDPTQVTGDSYKVTFNDFLIKGSDTLDVSNWDLYNTTTGEIVLNNQVIENDVNLVTGDTLGYGASPIIDGIQIIVSGPSQGIHGIWQVANANGPIAGADEDVNENILWLNFLTAPDYPTEQAQGGWFFVTHGGGTANDWDSFYARVFRGSNFDRAIPNDFEMRFTPDALANGMGYRRFEDGLIMGNVPFELWNVGPGTPDDPSDDYRMLPAILGYGGPDIDSFDMGGDDPSSSADNDPSSDWVYWGNPDDMSPGQAGYDAFHAPGIGNEPSGGWTEVIARTRIMNWNGYGGDDVTAIPEVGTIYRWITNKPNSPGNEFTFSTASLVGKTIEYNPSKIKVWPNPYFGYNPEEKSISDRQIHFTHLPEEGKCIIRIFDLAGTLVRKIEHNNGTQYKVWDVRDYYSNPVASGMYIVHIETVQGEKILKIAVVQPQF